MSNYSDLLQIIKMRVCENNNVPESSLAGRYNHRAGQSGTASRRYSYWNAFLTYIGNQEEPYSNLLKMRRRYAI